MSYSASCLVLLLCICLSFLDSSEAMKGAQAYSDLPSFSSKPHVAVLTDICNEPDDAQSLTRFLLYSNEFHVDALVATTSTWQRTSTHKEQIHQIIDAYATVVDNLNVHVPRSRQFPAADSLRSIVRSGLEGYGLEAARGPLSPGTELLISAIDAVSDHIWVLLWGGANVLAQALLTVKSTRTAEELSTFTRKVRVYAISDQDDSGPWIRDNFPDIFYIASVHAWNNYGLAAWTGISGESYYLFDQGGPDPSLVSNEWVQKHIQIGPYGKAAYPDPVFIIEGDTPTFLNLIQNGLSVPEKPEWGGWGGRYGLVDLKEGGSKHYADSADRVEGMDGKLYQSGQATIWRWRDAYQGDFAARMQWTLSDKMEQASHAPIIELEGHRTSSNDPTVIQAKYGETLTLDAQQSWTPDVDGRLSYKWIHYGEPSATQWTTRFEVPTLTFKSIGEDSLPNNAVVEVEIPGKEAGFPHPLEPGVVMKYGPKTYHVILEVTGSGTYPMKSYRRILLQVLEEEHGLKGKTHDEL